jgi:hypothetical protein
MRIILIWRSAPSRAKSSVNIYMYEKALRAEACKVNSISWVLSHKYFLTQKVVSLYNGTSNNGDQSDA